MACVTHPNDRQALAAIKQAAGLSDGEFYDRGGTVFVANNNGRVFELYLPAMDVTELPGEISKLADLEFLQIFNCKRLTKLPPEICMMSKLTRINVHCARLRELPSKPGTLPNLEYLCLGDCTELVEIPREYLVLPKLRSLDILGCSKLKTTAREIGESSFSLQRAYANDDLQHELDVYTYLNRSGVRSLLRKANVPPALWAVALSKISSDANVLHLFLKMKPDLFNSSHQLEEPAAKRARLS